MRAFSFSFPFYLNESLQSTSSNKRKFESSTNSLDKCQAKRERKKSKEQTKLKCECLQWCFRQTQLTRKTVERKQRICLGTQIEKKIMKRETSNEHDSCEWYEIATQEKRKIFHFSCADEIFDEVIFMRETFDFGVGLFGCNGSCGLSLVRGEYFVMRWIDLLAAPQMQLLRTGEQHFWLISVGDEILRHFETITNSWFYNRLQQYFICRLAAQPRFGVFIWNVLRLSAETQETWNWLGRYQTKEKLCRRICSRKINEFGRPKEFFCQLAFQIGNAAPNSAFYFSLASFLGSPKNTKQEKASTKRRNSVWPNWMATERDRANPFQWTPFQYFLLFIQFAYFSHFTGAQCIDPTNFLCRRTYHRFDWIYSFDKSNKFWFVLTDRFCRLMLDCAVSSAGCPFRQRMLYLIRALE